MSFCGGNSTKSFFQDTANSALKGNTPERARASTLAFATQKPGAPAREWPNPLVAENN
eukprot:gene35012-3778_t